MEQCRWMENVVITTMAFEPLANDERAFFRLRKIVGEEDSSTEHDRLRRRAATNEDALERVACAALSVYPHYQVWSASGGKCGAHSRAFLLSDWCIAVATWPAIGRLHTTNSRGVHYPWSSTQLHIRRKHTRPLSILHKRYSARTPHTHEYTYIHIIHICMYTIHTCMYGCYLQSSVRTRRSHRHIFVWYILEDSTRPRFATIVWWSNRNWPQAARKRATYAVDEKKTDESRQPSYPPLLDSMLQVQKIVVVVCIYFLITTWGWISTNPSCRYAQNHDKYVWMNTNLSFFRIVFHPIIFWEK